MKHKIDTLKKRNEAVNVLETLNNGMNSIDEEENDDVIDKVSAVINLDFCDIPVITNGRDGDPLHMRPFQNIFTKDKIRRSWSNVGFLPMTRKQLRSEKVRHEIGEGTDYESKLIELQSKYKDASKECIREGFNNVFVLDLPKKAELQRADNEEKQIEDILKNKTAFRPSGLFLNTKNMLASSHVLIQAQKRYLKKIDDDKLKKDMTILNENTNKKMMALNAYKIYNETPTMMKAQHWRALTRYVLPLDGDNAPSKFSTMQAMKERIQKLKKPLKEYLFEDSDELMIDNDGVTVPFVSEESLSSSIGSRIGGDSVYGSLVLDEEPAQCDNLICTFPNCTVF